MGVAGTRRGLCLPQRRTPAGLQPVMPSRLRDGAVHHGMQRVLEMPKVTAHLLTLPAVPVTGHTVETLTREVEQQMRAGLLELQRKVLKVMPDGTEAT